MWLESAWVELKYEMTNGMSEGRGMRWIVIGRNVGQNVIGRNIYAVVMCVLETVLMTSLKKKHGKSLTSCLLSTKLFWKD